MLNVQNRKKWGFSRCVKRKELFLMNNKKPLLIILVVFKINNEFCLDRLISNCVPDLSPDRPPLEQSSSILPSSTTAFIHSAFPIFLSGANRLWNKLSFSLFPGLYGLSFFKRGLKVQRPAYLTFMSDKHSLSHR